MQDDALMNMLGVCLSSEGGQKKKQSEEGEMLEDKRGTSFKPTLIQSLSPNHQSRVCST